MIVPNLDADAGDGLEDGPARRRGIAGTGLPARFPAACGPSRVQAFPLGASRELAIFATREAVDEGTTLASALSS